MQIVSAVRTFHVTSSTSDKRFLLQSDRAARLFLRMLQEYRAQGKFLLHEFVVMPDHFHVLITVGADTSVERAVQFIKGGFAFRAGKELGFKAPIWQRGFSEVRVRNAQTASNVCEYIRDNPVVARMVQKASDYPYSSAYPGCALDPLPQGLKPVSCEEALAARLKPCPDTNRLCLGMVTYRGTPSGMPLTPKTSTASSIRPPSST